MTTTEPAPDRAPPARPVADDGIAGRVHHHHLAHERERLPVAIGVEEVSKVFGRTRLGGVVALEDVSFEIRVGEFVSLIGPSGCGKSTLLRLVSGLAQPTRGHITINGRSPLEARRQRQFGIVFQSPVLFDWRTVEENIGLPLQIMREPRSKIDSRVGELVELVALTEFRHHHPWELSGGMQQRVAIARALTFRPPFLLMDEPFGALDLITRDRMAQELLRIWARAAGTTVMFITHSIPEAILLSDRVVVMSARPGRVVRTVSIDLPRPRTEDVRESEAFFEYETELRRLLHEAEATQQ